MWGLKNKNGLTYNTQALYDVVISLVSACHEATSGTAYMQVNGQTRAS